MTVPFVLRKHFAMGTVFEIVAYHAHPAHAATALDKAFQEIDRLEQVMSNYRPDSDLSQLNRSAHLRVETVCKDLYQVIEESLHYSALSDGVFDITAGPLANRWKAVGRGEPTPSPAEEEMLRRGVDYRKVELIPPNRIKFHSSGLRLDLGAIGKGYAVDRVADVLRTCGTERALINAGGSTVYGMGAPFGQSGWLIHLRDPSACHNPHVTLCDNSLATSEQTPQSLLGLDSFGHIVDPIAGRPLKSVLSVSVVARTATASDALSTALLLLGPAKGANLVKKIPSVAAVWISPEGSPKIVTSGPEIRLTQGDVAHSRT